MKNARTLALRDMALAAAMGALPSSFGGEAFEADQSFGSDFGNDWDWGFEFGDDYGADALAALNAPAFSPALMRSLGPTIGNRMTAPSAAAVAQGIAAPSPSQVAQVWNQAQQTAHRSRARRELLEPNAGSTVKVERYAFAVNQTLTLGVAVAIDASGQPDTNIRPQRVTMNAPSPGFITITEIKVANVSVSVGGTQDAFDYSAQAVGSHLDMPTLSPANRARVLGNYSGFVPPGFAGAASYVFCASFKGPASIVA